MPPPAPLTARNPEGCIYLGSFSKVLAPGLRLGFLVAPAQVLPKLLQAKQAADLHSPSFNQRMVADVLRDGFLERHVPTIRALYKAQRDAMLAALEREMRGLDVRWNTPEGGMFLWARLPAGMDAIALLPKAVERGVAFVPGAPFYADTPDPQRCACPSSPPRRSRSPPASRPSPPPSARTCRRRHAEDLGPLFINVRKVVLSRSCWSCRSSASMPAPPSASRRHRSTWRATRTHWCRRWRTTTSTSGNRT